MSIGGRKRRHPWAYYVVVVFGVLTCARVWLGPAQVLPEVHAQIPDSGLQRKELLEEVRRTNQVLAEIKQVLLTQTIQVRLQGADNHSGDK